MIFFVLFCVNVKLDKAAATLNQYYYLSISLKYFFNKWEVKPQSQ